MSKYTVADIKKLREETGMGMMVCKKCLEEANGDYEKAKELAYKKGMAKADKKQDRETNEGYIAAYAHANSKIAALVEILCETDFVAKNKDFKTMAQDLAMQVVAMNPTNVEELLAQDYIKNPDLSIEEYVKRTSGKIGEKFVINRFVRYQVGE